MAESNEPTATSPSAPTDRAAKARAAKAAKRAGDSEIAALREQVERLSQIVASQQQSVVSIIPENVNPAHAPGAYFIAGVDESGRKVFRKRKWTRVDIERAFPVVSFAPVITEVIRPMGVEYRLTAGAVATVPSIVKDLHDAMVLSIRRQSEGYRVSDEQSRRVFDEAKADPIKGRHYEPLKHVGFGWPIEPLTAVAQGKGDDPKTMEAIGWESEVGFPGGYEGKPIPTQVKA
jgi:hypothetical protein